MQLIDTPQPPRRPRRDGRELRPGPAEAMVSANIGTIRGDVGFAHPFASLGSFGRKTIPDGFAQSKRCRLQDSNPRPPDYKVESSIILSDT